MINQDRKHLIIIGAQRSGSTYLRSLLDQHPEIFMSRPAKPEPKYFLRDEPNLIEYINTVFKEAPRSTSYLGEKSTSYYETPEVSRRIQKILPQAHIIAILRNPTDRALSNYNFTYESGLETRSVEEVFLSNLPQPKAPGTISVNPFNYLERSNYQNLLSPFKETFGDKFHVILMEELVAGNLESLFAFLSLDTPTNIDRKRLRTNSIESLPVPDNVLRYLNSYFAPRIDSLETYLELDLSIWKA